MYKAAALLLLAGFFSNPDQSNGDDPSPPEPPPYNLGDVDWRIFFGIAGGVALSALITVICVFMCNRCNSGNDTQTEDGNDARAEDSLTENQNAGIPGYGSV